MSKRPVSSDILDFMDKRSDRLTAAYVDLAVNVCTAFGLSAAIRVLEKEAIAPAIVQRVLISRGPRREVQCTPESENAE